MAQNTGRKKAMGGLSQYLAQGGIDIPFFAILITIIVIGLVMLYSATYVYAYYYKEDSAYYFKRQILWVVIGLIAMLVVSHVNIEKFAGLFFLPALQTPCPHDILG